LLFYHVFFELNLSDTYNQVENSTRLRKFLNIENLLSLKQIREVYSRHDESKYLELALKTINKLNFKKIRGLKNIIIDSTALTLDLKFDGKYLSKQSLLVKDYKRAFSTSIGHYAGFKLTLAMEYETGKPLAILIYKGGPNDAKIFDEILNELKKDGY
jgi:hypothetical protein